MYIWHDGRYRSRVLLRAIPAPWYDPEVNVTDLEFSYKRKCLHLSLYSYINTFWWISLYFGIVVDIGFKVLLGEIPILGCDLDVKLQNFHIKVKTFCIKVYMTIINALWLISLVLGMMLHIHVGLKFFSASSPSWGMALRSGSQIFHRNVKVFVYILKTAWFHWYLLWW